MTDSHQNTPLPPEFHTRIAWRRWRRWRWFSNALLALVVVLTLLFAAGTWVLHGLIIPRINEFKPLLERQASSAMGVPVRVGEIAVQSGGWIPAVELRRVELLTPQGASALMLERVVLAISARSLWWRGFEQIDVDGPTLDVRRSKDGKWWVAGLEVQQGKGGNEAGADWFFSQPAVSLRKGTIHWTDELHDMPTASFSDVDVTLTNPGLRHRIKLQASPPAAWGERMQVLADLKQGWLQWHEGDWMQWSGQVFVDLPRTDVAELRKYLSRLMQGTHLQTGRGALRAWADIQEGDLVALTADVALQDVRVQWDDKAGKGLQPLELESLTGRLGGRNTAKETAFFTEGIKFTTADGKHWPGGNVKVASKKGLIGSDVQGEFLADRLDIGALAQIANRLPVSNAVHEWLQHLAPTGLIDEIRGNWSGEWDAPKHWQIQGKVSGIDWLSDVPTPTLAGAVPKPGRPGVRGLQAQFDVQPEGGRATIQVVRGALSFPGVFEQAEIPADELFTQVQWSSKGRWPQMDLDITLDKLKFANADARAEGRIRWKTGPQGKPGHLPGHLDLDLNLSKADATRVHRYLPLGIPKQARDYVKDAIVQGHADDVKARVKGDLLKFPFTDGSGEFHIRAQVRNAQYAYVPARLSGASRWPALTQLNGELIFDRSSMEVRGATAKLADARNLTATQVQARIANLDQPVVQVQGEIKGPLTEMLELVKRSQINNLLGGALSGASGQGDASTKLKLELPLDKLESSKVEGAVALLGNDLRITQDAPTLLKTKGAIQFSDKGFKVDGAQAQFLGGELKIQGGSQGAGADMQILLQGQGVVTAAGLRDAKELGLPAVLAKNATGSTAYTARVSIRKGHPEVSVQSTMQGLATGLPAPFGKSAEAVLPLRYEQQMVREASATASLQDLVRVDVGRLLNVDIYRDVSGVNPKVLRGTIGVGQAAANELGLPDKGVAASVVLDALDLDAWEKALASGDPRLATAPAGSVGASSAAVGYLPNYLAMRVGSLSVGGRSFRNVVLGGGHEGALWRVNLDADELSGYAEYREGTGSNPGALHARLARLSLAASAANELERSLDEQPLTIPGMDIEVEDFELKGRKLGRLEISAGNQMRAGAREWRLHKLNLTMPEATLQASGNWVRVGEQSGASVGRVARAPRRTALKFKLESQDSGALLKRMGLGDLLRKTPGSLEGQIAWVGSPMAMDHGSLSGQMKVDFREGQFLKVEPGGARLLGVLSLQSLPRRLALDFRDVFSEGFAFDSIRGDVTIESGIAKTNNLQMKGVIAGVLLEGTANISKETQDLHVVVVPEINAGSASLFAAAVNPVVGLGTFLAQAILRRPLIKQNTQEFKIEGSWADPKVTKLDKTDEPASLEPASAATGAKSQ